MPVCLVADWTITFFAILARLCLLKRYNVRRRKALLDKMKGERGIALFIGNVDALLSTIA